MNLDYPERGHDDGIDALAYALVVWLDRIEAYLRQWLMWYMGMDVKRPKKPARK